MRKKIMSPHPTLGSVLLCFEILSSWKSFDGLPAAAKGPKMAVVFDGCGREGYRVPRNTDKKAAIRPDRVAR